MSKITAVQKIIAIKLSSIAVPKGGGFADGMNFLNDKDKFIDGVIEAKNWFKNSVAEIRSAPEPNPYKNMTDEEIAESMLQAYEKLKGMKNDIRRN